MKAVQIKSYGDVHVLEVNENAQVPPSGETQVLVQVHAASLNPMDIYIRSGMVPSANTFPLTLGGDFSGVVKEVGKGASSLKPGDQVYGYALLLNGGSGSFAEIVVSNEENTWRKPQKADFTEAAAVPLTGTSAIQALEDHIVLKRGQKILIHGGAGGIGHMAIQLAKKTGAFVATTVASRDISFVKELGADMIIDYTKEEFDKKLSGFDAVFDTVGGDVYSRSFRVLKEGGIVNSMLEQPDEKLEEQYKVRANYQMTIANQKRLARLAELVDSGAVKVFIDRKFPLSQAGEAFRFLESEHTRGKVVITIK